MTTDTDRTEISQEVALTRIADEFEMRGWRSYSPFIVEIVRAAAEPNRRISFVRLAHIPPRYFLTVNAISRRDIQAALKSALSSVRIQREEARC